MKKITNTEETAVAAFYKFVDWDDFKGLKPSLTKVCSKAGTVGTILLAPEGINGTIAGTVQGVQTVLEFLWDDQRLVDLTPKYSTATGKTQQQRIRDHIQPADKSLFGLFPQCTGFVRSVRVCLTRTPMGRRAVIGSGLRGLFVVLFG